MTALNRDDIYGYEVRLTRIADGDGGGWLAEVPDLAGCMSDGDTPEKALVNVREAIECWIAAAEEDGDVIPAPRTHEDPEYSGKFTLRLPRSLHRRLSERARREGISLNQLLLSIVSFESGVDWHRSNQTRNQVAGSVASREAAFLYPPQRMGFEQDLHGRIKLPSTPRVVQVFGSRETAQVSYGTVWEGTRHAGQR